MRRILSWITVMLWLGLASCATRSGMAPINAGAKPDEQVWPKVQTAEVIYVGETHDDPVDHQYEIKLIRGMLKRKMKFAIGWEMFDTNQQGVIDAWASHQISLGQMLAKTDFQKHWGIYSSAYRQILQIAGNSNVPNLALNAPPELVHKIARGQPMTPEEKAMIPTGFVATEQSYRNFVALMGNHPGMKGADQRRFFEAQNIWDQTMANRILEFKSRHPDIPLVVFTGRGHVSGGYGIPFYVRQKQNLKQIIFLPKGGHG